MLKRVEFSKAFITGVLKDIKLVDVIITDSPEWYVPGKIYQAINGDLVEIKEVVIEDL